MLSKRAMFLAMISKNPVTETNSEFRIQLDQKYVASVTYQENDIIDLVHSQVPEDLQGMGLGTKLAERIFEHVSQKKKKFTISCDFLKKVYNDKFKEKYTDIYVGSS